MMDALAPKATSFFQMRFEGAIKRFAAQGYPPLGEDMDFIDCAKVLSEFPPDTFAL